MGVAAALSAAKAKEGSSGASDVVVSESVPLSTGAPSCSVSSSLVSSSTTLEEISIRHGF